MEFDLQAIKRYLEKEQNIKPIPPSPLPDLGKMEIGINEEELSLHFDDTEKDNLTIRQKKDGITVETPRYTATISVNIHKKDK